MLDVRRLQLLRELAHRGTIAAVAEAMTFTASAVSQQLSVLEKEAGVALLERTGRRVVLTPAGRGLVDHADAVLARLEQAQSDLASAREGLGGPLRIGTFPSAGRTIVPAALADLVRDHPRLEPMVADIDSARVADALRARELDVALIHDYDFVPAPPDTTVDTLPLLEERMYLASRAAPGQQAGSVATGASIADLVLPWRDAPWITAMPGTTGHTMALRTCRTAGFEPRIRHHVNDFSAVLLFVAAGQGVALLPRLGVMDPPPGVRLTGLPAHRRSKVAFRGGSGEHPAVRAFVGSLRTAIADVL
ncbi:LysR family transcriptional regulator [Allosaccharopolyspora coralli]|uniref:LysR family transcriptional regulator n=1 Tax=Allosaccharopolyspora coralli TaxID=2665642 RepID=A0A5Q3Q406_9PSEU|nr:LysR family transcriptional regulator [Allosaccharopolyspora coralli]QGK69351.1 LysR family transcriptional regulator [Allosaccharopolyspora coralli]